MPSPARNTSDTLEIDTVIAATLQKPLDLGDGAGNSDLAAPPGPQWRCYHDHADLLYACTRLLYGCAGGRGHPVSSTVGHQPRLQGNPVPPLLRHPGATNRQRTTLTPFCAHQDPCHLGAYTAERTPGRQQLHGAGGAARNSTAGTGPRSARPQ